MAIQPFPTELFCRSICRFLDAIEYHDDNLTHELRTSRLHAVYQGTEAYFRSPLPNHTLRNLNPRRIAFMTRTISQLVVCCWPKLSVDAQIDLSIFMTIMNVLDDEMYADPSISMTTFWQDLLDGKAQRHPFWILTNAHLPNLLRYYGNFCSYNIIRSTFDYFQGCWVEQTKFQGFCGAHQYPDFVRRLNALGGAVGGSLFPMAEFDEQVLFDELSCVMAQIDQVVALVNDLFSSYKEWDQQEPNLITNWCVVHDISLIDAFTRLTDEATSACKQLLGVFEDKHPAVFATLNAFVHGYVTYHFCEFRYRLDEVYDAVKDEPFGVQFKHYYEKAVDIGRIDTALWTAPQEKPLTVEDALAEGPTMSHNGLGDTALDKRSSKTKIRVCIARILAVFNRR